ncbi:MAG: tRNA preQ1(34) S-adenosylmethionine ribosyltransferase-isomerase QueA [Gemmatimonadales bacterium]|nr:MAG: tRNA preQ1(34) S-adenosylmethionine ribosyltransferase-isomerase QueA [Gemmatimonadales bacterium]
MGERTSDYEYHLPADLIASRPTPARDGSRLLVVDSTGVFTDRMFPDLVDYISPGDALVLNQTRVFPARLIGRKPTGAGAEVLLVRPRPDLDPSGALFEALVRPGGKLKPGRIVEFAAEFRAVIEDSARGGARIVRLEGDGDPWELIERHGHVPLPPYIARDDDEADRERYQTVFATHRGSVAAPTAGLHFTPELLDRIEGLGIHLVRITLHVGVGTFRPVSAARPEDHELHSEWYRVESEAARILNEVRDTGGRIWAVGTTSVRTLESVLGSDGRFRADEGWTDLFIRPPYEFRAVDALVTNFHLPRSSLLMLVSALAGRERILAAYDHAVAEGYRFYSYGDAMVIP